MHLNSEQLATLEAAVATLLPAPAGFGTMDAHATDYLLIAVESPANQDLRGLLQEGLEFLDTLARESQGRRFVDCCGDGRTTVLRVLEAYPNNRARRFFDRLLELCLEGYLCDPQHGGNAGARGWLLMGYSPGQGLTSRSARRSS